MNRRTGKYAILMERDGTFCVWCGKHTIGDASKDHVIPKGKGGPNHPDNYLLACRKCNNKRGMQTVWEYFNQAKAPRMDIIIQGWVRATEYQTKVLEYGHDSRIR